jgi:class 3 adenylate cyclase
MLKWELSGADVEAADASPWDGPLAGAVRPFNTRTLTAIMLGAALSFEVVGLSSLFLVYSPGFLPRDPTVLRFNAWFVVATGLAFFVLPAVLPPGALRRSSPVVTLVTVLSTPIVVTVGIAGCGPAYGDFITGTYVIAPLFAFFMCRIPWATASAAIALTGYAAVLTVQDGWSLPAARWAYVAAVVGTTAIAVGLLAARSDKLAAAEVAAKNELAELNNELERRVDEQVGEIEQLSRLRRFLSPQVADALMSQDTDISEPHRRRIAVLFCDLRGFTAFTRAAEPEEVILVLEEYYRTVGTRLHESEAAIGSYAGDGIMAYLGDPIRRDDAAAAMVATARAIGKDMADLVALWRRRGFDLHFGIGIGFGYATLGVVGFDGRYDYTPIGGVVNLAARLCARAGPGETLIDHASYVALDGAVACEPLSGLELKGFAADVTVHRLVVPTG